MFKEFVEQVDPDHLMDCLIQEHVIGVETRCRLKNHVMYPTPQALCRELMGELLSSSHPTAFLVVREALQEDYGWIVDKIDETESKQLRK